MTIPEAMTEKRPRDNAYFPGDFNSFRQHVFRDSKEKCPKCHKKFYEQNGSQFYNRLTQQMECCECAWIVYEAEANKAYKKHLATMAKHRPVYALRPCCPLCGGWLKVPMKLDRGLRQLGPLRSICENRATSSLDRCQWEGEAVFYITEAKCIGEMVEREKGSSDDEG